MLERLRRVVALRQNYDAEWVGEVGTFVWRALARGEAKASASALYECEHANRVALGNALREQGRPLAIRNLALIAPAAIAGVGAALTPMAIHRRLFGTPQATRQVRRNFARLARRHGPTTAPVFVEVGERHAHAFQTFAV